ncbi:hypothetical protein [Jannaschia formosa]|uniref:hypothetical protein n=1 Tax=Jannaschia formosa TaxID=2259592 RepID=UPI000E1BFDD0|nr:hypothetical protein [Jannaschia formosa]TFL16494.1 hypothetical protein DR046_19915 [Jannaschia formosa]
MLFSAAAPLAAKTEALLASDPRRSTTRRHFTVLGITPSVLCPIVSASPDDQNPVVRIESKIIGDAGGERAGSPLLQIDSGGTRKLSSEMSADGGRCPKMSIFQHVAS